jgi:hypothetical protein
MQFTNGDRVRHRGLRFISGIVVNVMRMPDTNEQDDRSYFCKVELENGQFYTDRTTEWEPEVPSFSPIGS